MTRSPLGRAAFADAEGSGKLEEFSLKVNPNYASQAMTKVRILVGQETQDRAAEPQNSSAQEGVQIKAGAADVLPYQPLARGRTCNA